MLILFLSKAWDDSWYWWVCQGLKIEFPLFVYIKLGEKLTYDDAYHYTLFSDTCFCYEVSLNMWNCNENEFTQRDSGIFKERDQKLQNKSLKYTGKLNDSSITLKDKITFGWFNLIELAFMLTYSRKTYKRRESFIWPVVSVCWFLSWFAW